MWASFVNSLSLQKYEREEQRRLAFILKKVIEAYWLASILGILLSVLGGNQQFFSWLLVGGVLQFISVWFLLKGHLAISSVITIGLYIGLTTLFATISHGIYSYTIMLYPITIMFAGLLGRRKGLFYSTLLVLLAIAWLILGERYGWYTANEIPGASWIDFVAAGTVILLGAMAVHLLISDLNHGLTQTWQELAERKRIEKALAQSEYRFRSYIQNAPNTVTIVDQDFKIQYINRVDSDIPLSVFIGSSILNFIPPEQHQEVKDTIARARLEQQPGMFISSMPLEGETVWHENYVMAAEPESISSDMIVISVNITDRVNMYQALKTSEARYQALVEASPDAIALVDVHGNILACNQQAASLQGANSPDDLCNHNVMEFVPKSEMRKVRRKIFESTYKEGGRFIESVFLRKDGSPFIGELSVSTVIDEAGKPAQFILVNRDITERRRIEADLRESRENYLRFFEMSTLGMAITTPEKGWIQVNDRLCEMLGYSREELNHLTWSELTYPDDLKDDLVLFDQLTAGDLNHYQMDKRFIHKNQSLVYTSIFVSCHRNPDSSIQYYMASLIDITERILAEEALEENREMFRLLAENVSDVIWILDYESQRFRYVSPSVQKLIGFSPEEILAADLSFLLTPAGLDGINHLLPDRRFAFEQGQKLHYTDELEQVCLDGSTIWAETITSFQRNKRTAKLELYGVSRDITERRRSEAMMRLRLELMEDAVVSSLEGFTRKALDKISAFTSSPVAFFHTVEADQKTLSLQAWSTLTLEAFCKVIGEKDHAPAELAGVWADCIREKKPVIHNDFMALPNRGGLPLGHVSVIREIVAPVNRGGNIVAVLGLGNKSTDYSDRDLEVAGYLADVVCEIVKRKQTEQILNETETRLRLLSENMEEAVLFTYARQPNGASRFEYISAGVEKVTGIKAEEIVKDIRVWNATILPEYHDTIRKAENLSNETLSNCEFEFCQRNAQTGEIFWSMVRSTPRHRPDGSTVWYGVLMDVTAQKKNEEMLEKINKQLVEYVDEIELLHIELQEQAIRDPLTGLYNRRYLDDMLERELVRSERERKPLSVVMIDIDHFKRINDTYGHHVGDRFLVEIASMITARTRGSDLACRYGGEEFLLALPGATPMDARIRADEIRRACAEIIIPAGDRNLTVTLSMGISSFPDHHKQLYELLTQADAAMYQSKHAGRDCITVWNEQFYWN